jgi:hypothetical protein
MLRTGDELMYKSSADLATHLQHKNSMMIWSVCKLQQAGTKGIPQPVERQLLTEGWQHIFLCTLLLLTVTTWCV